MKTKNSHGNSKAASRRSFTKTVAATLVCAPLSASLANAQTPATTKQAPAPPNPQPSPAQAQPSPVAEAYAEVARARFGEQVTAEQFEQIKKDLEGNVRVAERLRAVKLKNGDEPDFVFNAE
jgi:glucose/arabinose dehydrogenase